MRRLAEQGGGVRAGAGQGEEEEEKEAHRSHCRDGTNGVSAAQRVDYLPCLRIGGSEEERRRNEEKGSHFPPPATLYLGVWAGVYIT